MGVNIRAELGIKLGSQSLEGALVISSSIYGMTGVRNKASWNAELRSASMFVVMPLAHWSPLSKCCIDSR